MQTVFIGIRSFKAGKLINKTNTCIGIPEACTTKTNIAPVKTVVEHDIQMLEIDTSNRAGMSEGSVDTVLKRHL